MKNTNNFCYEGKPSCATAKLTLFTVSKDEECIVHTEGTSRAKVILNSDKIKPVALAVVELPLSEGISQLLSQSVEYSVK